MTSFAADIRDLERLAGDPYEAFKERCAEGSALVRRAREAVEQHWYEMDAEGQAAARALAVTIRAMPASFGEFNLGQRLLMLAKAGWIVVMEPKRGVPEAISYAAELIRFARAVEAQIADQERRQRWLFENATIDPDACVAAKPGDGQAFSIEQLRARVAEKR